VTALSSVSLSAGKQIHMSKKLKWNV